MSRNQSFDDPPGLVMYSLRDEEIQEFQRLVKLDNSKKTKNTFAKSSMEMGTPSFSTSYQEQNQPNSEAQR